MQCDAFHPSPPKTFTSLQACLKIMGRVKADKAASMLSI